MNQLQTKYINEGRESDFRLWFNVEYIEDEKNVITAGVASEFLWESMLSKGNIDIIKDKIKEISGQNDIEIKCKIKNTSVSSNAINTSENSEIIEHNEKTVEIKSETLDVSSDEELKPHPQLLDKFRFETFVPGENSDYAFRAACAAAVNPGKKYNPILFYGGVGLGKTHLMQSIGQYIYKERKGNVKLCYLSAEAFTNEFIYSITSKTTEKFKNKYRTLDVLLLDDIHFLKDKAQTQEELFYTFDALRDRYSQMVFTCDRPISELKFITDRLRSRFGSGLCVDLQPPNYETRIAIITKKLEFMNKSIPEDVIAFMAKNVETNVRDLESAIVKMVGYAELIKKTLTIDIAKELLKDTFNASLPGNITVDRIQKVIADYYNISVSDIKGRKRDKRIVFPRQIAIYISRELTDYSYPDLGIEFGGKDHTTIMHSYNTISDQLKTDSSLDSTINILVRSIKEAKS